MEKEMLERAMVINSEMIDVSSRVKEMKDALQTIENGYVKHKLSIHGNLHVINFDPWVIKKALKLNIDDLEKRYSALSVELEEL